MGNVEFFNELARKRILSNARMVPFDFEIYTKTFTDIDKKLKFLPADSVLDLGGGTGQITAFIAEKVRKVVLADGATEALTVAKDILRDLQNVTFKQVDLNTVSLPFDDSEFDKIVCYSVIHYLDERQKCESLFAELLRISKPGGRLLIADIPLADKKRVYLAERKKHFFKHLMASISYHFQKAVTDLIYKFKGVDEKQVSGLHFTRGDLENILGRLQGINYQWLIQDSSLPFANSREDLLIVKL